MSLEFFVVDDQLSSKIQIIYFTVSTYFQRQMFKIQLKTSVNCEEKYLGKK